MKAPGTERSILTYDNLLSNFVLNSNMRSYIQGAVRGWVYRRLFLRQRAMIIRMQVIYRARRLQSNVWVWGMAGRSLRTSTRPTLNLLLRVRFRPPMRVCTSIHTECTPCYELG